MSSPAQAIANRCSRITRFGGFSIRTASSLLDHETLDRASEIAAAVRQPRRGETRAIRSDPGFRIEQNPFADRLPGKTDGEVGLDEGPLPKIQRRGGAVAEVRGNHGPHRLRNRR